MRAITKSFNSVDSIVDILTASGDIETVRISGKRLSERAAEAHFKKTLGTSNFAIFGISYEGNDNERKYSLPAETFIANASVCEEGLSYGHEFVTTTVKVTLVDFRRVETPKVVDTIVYPGVTTLSKLRKYIADSGVGKFVISDQQVSEIRYFMTKEKFIELCESKGTVK